jgi:hypothetical protein
MSKLLESFQEIVSRNFPFDFTKEQEIWRIQKNSGCY